MRSYKPAGVNHDDILSLWIKGASLRAAFNYGKLRQGLTGFPVSPRRSADAPICDFDLQTPQLPHDIIHFHDGIFHLSSGIIDFGLHQPVRHDAVKEIIRKS